MIISRNIFKVYKEAYAALHSIFTTSDLDDFFALDRDTKLQFLVELADLVMGIRLFNRNCQKGGKGIDDSVFHLSFFFIHFFPDIILICNLIIKIALVSTENHLLL